MVDTLLGIPERLWKIYITALLALLMFTMLAFFIWRDQVLILWFRLWKFHSLYWRKIDALTSQLEGYSEEREYFRELYYNEVTAHEQTKRERDQAINDRDRYRTRADDLARQIQEHGSRTD